jgi:hypothetical protein
VEVPLLPAGTPAAAAVRVAVEVDYRVTVVDVDPKPLARLPHYARLEAALCATHAAHGARVMAAAGAACGLPRCGWRR